MWYAKLATLNWRKVMQKEEEKTQRNIIEATRANLISFDETFSLFFRTLTTNPP